MMSDRPHLLLVDDERSIREPLAQYLVRNGFRVTAVENAAEARLRLNANAIDLVILDIMMPGEDGLSLCRHIRETSEIPVILLTARSEETDRIVGLEMGAEDYLPKPCNPRELLARIRTVLRRHRRQEEETADPTARKLRFAGWQIDMGARLLTDPDNVVVTLTDGEFRLLRAFIEHPRRVLSRDQLLDITQGREANAFDRAIDNQISRLRKKIEPDPKNPTLIKTVWGGGYTLSAEVRKL